MARTYVGVDIQSQGLTVAALQRGRPNHSLLGLRFESLAGVFEFSSRQPNIRDTRRFVEGLRRATDTLAGTEERIALCLPDRVGRLFLTEIDAPFKSRQEGVDILKWRLKSSLPLPPAQTHLDFQVLDRREEGLQKCLVAAIAHPVLEQYEDLVSEAGRHAVNIDFHSLNLYNYYRPRLDLGEEFVLVCLEEGLLSLQYFTGTILSYQRSREVRNTPEHVFRELNRTIVELYESYPPSRRCQVFANVDPGQDDAMSELLKSVFEREIHTLDPALKRFGGPGKTGGLEPTGAVVAALGAAERLIKV